WSGSKCGGAVAIPEDPAIVMARCAFCGTDNVAPDFDRRRQLHEDRLRAEGEKRVDAIELLRLEERRVERLAKATEARSSKRLMYFGVAICAISLVIAVVLKLYG
ncbi:MAG: hypothetical protein ABI175_21550, partial [Polyangiales bacterium]